MKIQPKPFLSLIIASILKVVIDVVTKFPRLSGEEISKKVRSNLLEIKKALQVTQIYTIPFIESSGLDSTN